MIYLKEWSVVPMMITSYTAPESIGFLLKGQVFGHPEKKDGKFVLTSKIVKVNGKLVYTLNGSEYFIDGPPCQEYMQFLENSGIIYNPEEPLNFKNRK